LSLIKLLEARDISVADEQGDRLDALAFGADHQPLEVVVGMILGLLLAEEQGEAFVKLDQLLGRGAHVVRCHGGGLLTGCSFGDGLASPSRVWVQTIHSCGESKEFLRL
jgi:hypothetical protein